MSSPSRLANQGSKLLSSRNRSEYEHYEDDLSNYRRKNYSQLQQWNMMQSKFIPSKSPKPFSNLQNKNKNNKQSKNASNSQKINNRNMSEQSEEIKSSIKGEYSHKVMQNFDKKSIDKKNNEQISSDIKKMRQMLIQLNDLVNSKLNKYELAHFLPKGLANSNGPEKQSQLLQNQIEINCKYLQSQKKQIQNIIKRDRELEQKDFLIQLEERTDMVIKQIHDKSHEKHHKGVTVQKLDSKLIELRDNALQDEYKIVKVLKHQIWHYFKKFHENRAISDELDDRYKQLERKDQETTAQYNNLMKMAQQKNLMVKANKNYLENKKIQDQLKDKAEQARKKIQVTEYSLQVNTQKIFKQNNNLKKQIESVQARTQQMNQISTDFAQKADGLIEKHHIGESMINSLPYRFAQTLLKDSRLRNEREVIQANQIQSQNVKKEQKFYLKPQLNFTKNKNRAKIGNHSQQATSRNRTLEPGQSSRYLPQKYKNLNDKNHQSIDFSAEGKPRLNMKPNLRIRKITDKNQSRLKQNQLQINQNQSKMIQMPYKPSRLNRIKSNKKQVPGGPLPDSYMKNLENKGKKNLQQI